jgi:transglutaminase-like putative cysteine protease
MALAQARDRSYWVEQRLPYGAAALINIAAVLSAWPLYLEPSFPYLALALIVFGTPVSMYFRATGVNRRLLNISIVGVSFAFIFMSLTRTQLPGGGQGLLSMALVMEDRVAVGLVVQMFITVAMFRSFSLLTDNDLTLTIVPAVSTLLLSAIIVRGAWIMVALLVFFLGALYLLAFHHQETVARQAQAGRLLGRTRRRSLLAAATAGMWLVLVPIVFAVAVVFSFVNLPRTLLVHYGQYTEDIFTRRLLQWVAPAWITPGGAMRLGGGISQRNNILFKVDCTESALWRAGTMDTYTGQGWQNSEPLSHGERLTRQGETWFARDTDPGVLAGVPSTELRQTYELQVPMQGVVITAYQAHSLTGPFGKPRVTDSSVITSMMPFRGGTAYSVVSRRKEAPGTKSYRKGVTLSPGDRERYLALPRIPERTQRRAREITAKERDQLHQALALRAYLESKFVYRARVTPPPRNVDATDYFLFHMDGAYCDYFASAMAVMARLNGIPSRVVTGYSSDEEEEKTGLWIVREKHAHSWVEVFIDRYGWFELDPSPQPGRRTALIERMQTGIKNALKAVKAAALAPVRALSTTPGWWWKLPAAVIALAGVVLGVRYLVRDKPPPLPRNGDGEQLRQYVGRCYERMCQWLAKWGLPKLPGATATEYSLTLARALGPQAVPMRDVIQAYLDVEYGGRRVEVSDARGVARRLEDVLAVRSRLARMETQSEKADLTR